MPTDRLNRLAPGLGLALILVATAPGCKSTPSEVPTGRAFHSGAQQQPPPTVGFSTTPGASPYDGLSASRPSVGNQYGVPAPSDNPFGAPTGNQFGPPGSAGMSTGNPPSATPTGGYNPTTTLPGGGFSPFGSSPAPGTMGTPGQAPSPL